MLRATADEAAGPGPSSLSAPRRSSLAQRLPGMTSARWRSTSSRGASGGGGGSSGGAPLPPGCAPSSPDDWPAIAAALAKLLLFGGELGGDAAAAAARATYERRVEAGDILVTEGGGGGERGEKNGGGGGGGGRLFIVKEGTFEVRERRAGGSHVRTCLKGPGDAFGEAGLLLAGGGEGEAGGGGGCGATAPPPTTVAATSRGSVWVLERRAFRRVARAAGEARASEVGLFLNAVPALARLDGPARSALACALRPASFPAGSVIFREGDPSPPRPGEPAFFIIRSGEAVVHARAGGPGAAGAGAAGAALAAGGRAPPTLAHPAGGGDGGGGGPSPPGGGGGAAAGGRAVKLNHLFRGDCFGERALLAAIGLEGGGGGASAATPTPTPPTPPLLLPRRTATVEAVTDLAVLALDAPDFFALVAPEAAAGLAAAKAPPAVAQRLLRLHARGAPAPAPATVLLHRLVGPPRGPADPPPEAAAARWEVVRARGHLDEVMELVAAAGGGVSGGGGGANDGGGTPASAWPDWPLPPGLVTDPSAPPAPSGGGGRRGKKNGGGGGGSGALSTPTSPTSTTPPTLVLVEGPLLGGGAFARVTAVAQAPTGRVFALKRMPKAALAACPEHVYCEQAITRSAAHPLCVRQYASFQDAAHLYMLFDALPGGDLMDVLVAEARVVLARVPRGPGPAAGAAAAAPGGSTGKAAPGPPPPPPRPPPWWVPPCFAPRTRLLRGMPEPLARFYAGCVVEALAYLHARGIVYRDLKPENVLVDGSGYARLGDFGFAKALDPATGRTYTFCGTPGYVAPENVLAHGYGPSVDWWGLGVLVYVLLTGRQPFSSPRTDDPMAVMRRIVDEAWAVPLPPYLSPAARDLLTKLLERKPHRRLGCGPRGVADVRGHRWFAGLDWGALADRRLVPPRSPKPSDVAKRLADLAAAEKGKARAAAAGAGGGGGKASAKEAADAAREADAVFAEF
jgi:serine/threonine protein kinase/CRP-like cAMP-binding protein